MSSPPPFFVGLAGGAARLRDYHVIDESGRPTIGGLALTLAGTVALLVPALAVAAALLTRASSLLVFWLPILLMGAAALGAAFLKPRIAGVLTVTSHRLIYYRRESGPFRSGHSYSSVWLRDVCGVTTWQATNWGQESISITILTTKSDAIVAGPSAGSALAKLPLVGVLFRKGNKGPDADRALQELPAYLPEMRRRQGA
jgi:hypothetical protein